MTNLRPGFILVFRNKSLLGFLVRLFTKFQYNHIAIVSHIDHYDDKVIIFESSYDGVIQTKMSLYSIDNKNIACYTVNRDDCDTPELAVKLANSYFGEVKYDFWNLFVYQPIYRIFGFWIGKQTKDRMTCAEFVANCFPKLFSHYDKDKLSVKDVLNHPKLEKRIILY
ncbi:MAG: hypothetical protein SFU98_15840 [Leptospiraceae bacterium]|nr:hypothetical protein [Leptospiraceae bacterium]